MRIPPTGPKAWQTVSDGEHWLFDLGASARGSPPETLSMGWLPAVRFIPTERVSGELPPQWNGQACFSHVESLTVR
jgi:hypothetical protein